MLNVILLVGYFQNSDTLSIREPRAILLNDDVRKHIMLYNNAKYIINEYYDDDKQEWICRPSIIGCVLQDQVLTFDSLYPDCIAI